tara:strand:- start:653 stop:805 length:153 start_codon:yes stop_codon:yes gene_type:complete
MDAKLRHEAEVHVRIALLESERPESAAIFDELIEEYKQRLAAATKKKSGE